MKQEMMGWQWQQLDHMQIIRISLQRDNRASTLSLNFYRPEWCSFWRPTSSVKALKAKLIKMRFSWFLGKKNLRRVFRRTVEQLMPTADDTSPTSRTARSLCWHSRYSAGV